MLKILVTFFFFFFIFLGCTKSFNENNMLAISTATNDFRSVVYVRAVDGDTIVVNLPNPIPDVFGKNIPVRLRHIDAPEIKSLDICEQTLALKAKDYTHSILKSAKKIDLENVSREKYFRLLADVLVDKKSVAKLLLDQKLAVTYEGEKKNTINWCIPTSNFH